MKTALQPRSPLWMVVLALACEEPMHPYRMQTLIKARGKDHIANVTQRNSVYQTIDALLRAGLIAVHETTAKENRPERTSYEATEDGRQALRRWLRTALSAPAREFPDFPAALSLLDPSFTPAELSGLLKDRVTALHARLRRHEQSVPNLPRLFLLEEEYMAAIVRAELAWLDGIIADLESGRLRFPSEAELRNLSSLPGAPSQEAISKMAERLGPKARTDKPRRSPAQKRRA